MTTQLSNSLSYHALDTPLKHTRWHFKTLLGASILHRGDLKKCPDLLNYLNKFFKPQISLVTIICPSGSSKGIFQFCFIMPKLRVREAPSWSRALRALGPVSEAPGRFLKCSILRYSGEAKKPPCLPGYTMSEQKLIQFSSTADTCKNCAECGKGFKIVTNEA